MSNSVRSAIAGLLFVATRHLIARCRDIDEYESLSETSLVFFRVNMWPERN